MKWSMSDRTEGTDIVGTIVTTTYSEVHLNGSKVLINHEVIHAMSI